MSLQSLYTISKQVIGEAGFEARITFDPAHEIFKGHFPGQSIVPGVCLISIVKNMAGFIAKKDLVLKLGNNIKFLNIVDPKEHPDVSLSGSFSYLEDGNLKITASICQESLVFFKFKGTYQIS
jgi:3-hydroxyacyl-[acyl-carrier-protein] dehydratase